MQKRNILIVAACLAAVILTVCLSGVSNYERLSDTSVPATEVYQATVTVADADTTTTEPAIPDALEMLAIVIYREAGGDACSNRTRIMVGNVVMNRVQSDRFPNTVYDVLTQKGQYAGVNGAVTWPTRASLTQEQHAVDRAYACAQKVIDGKQLLPANVVYQSNFPNLGSGIYCYADGMYFNYE